MSSWQRVLFALAVVCAVALLAPAALANGPSAGDQQYIDPLSGHHHNKSNNGSGSSTTTPSTSAPTTSTPAPPPVTTTTTPAATSASSTPSSSTTTSSSRKRDPSGKTLPFTGFDVWLAAGLGLGLLAAGAYLRRVSSQA